VDGVPERVLAGVLARQRAGLVAHVPHLDPPRGAAAPGRDVVEPVRRRVREHVRHGPVHVAVDDPGAAAEASVVAAAAAGGVVRVQARHQVAEARVEVPRHGVVLFGARARGGVALQREAPHGREPVEVQLARAQRVQRPRERLRHAQQVPRVARRRPRALRRVAAPHAVVVLQEVVGAHAHDVERLRQRLLRLLVAMEAPQLRRVLLEVVQLFPQRQNGLHDACKTDRSTCLFVGGRRRSSS